MFERRYSGYGISRKTNSDQDTIPTKLTKTTDSWTNTDVWNKKAKHASEDGSSLTISQFHYPNKEIKSKRIKENQSREICDKTKELKNLDYNHKYRNTVNKKAAAKICDSILNGIDQHGLSNESFKVRVKNHPGATAEYICHHLKPEIWKKSVVVIIHDGTNDLTNNSKSIKIYKRAADSVRSKLPNGKPAISNVTIRKDKNDIDKKAETFNIKLSNFCKRTK